MLGAPGPDFRTWDTSSFDSPKSRVILSGAHSEPHERGTIMGSPLAAGLAEDLQLLSPLSGHGLRDYDPEPSKRCFYLEFVC
jgi:hypothetical protein